MKRLTVSGIRGRAQQQGYMLLSMLFGLAILATMMVMAARLFERHNTVTRARTEGEALGQFAVGLRGLVAAAQTDPSLLPSGVQVGVDWLKPPSCGGRSSNPAEGYVPCSFNGRSFGDLYRTSFTFNAATRKIEARTNFVVPGMGGGPESVILFADHVVAAALSTPSLPNSGTFYDAYANVPASATGVASGAAIFNPGADAGRVVVVVDNAPSNDVWLRTDGTNSMKANLNMGGSSIANAKDARFTGDVQVDDSMVIGASGILDVRGDMRAPDIELTDIGKFASQGVYDALTVEGSGPHQVAKPDCSRAGNRPGIYVAMQSTGGLNSGGYRADAMYSAGARVVDSGGHWTIYPEATGVRFDLQRSGLDMVFSKTVVSATPPDMRMVVLTRCR